MNIRIPKQRWEALINISDMSDEAVKTLFGALAQIPPQNYRPDLPERLAEQLETTDLKNVSEVVDTLLSLFPLIISANKPLSDVLDDIIVAVKTRPVPGRELDSDQLERLRINLQKLLRVPSMGLGAKATGVLFDNPNNFLNARLITDLRPVFELENLEIGGAIILHTLKIEFGSDGSADKEFFVAMDNDDIESLIGKLQRALTKGEKLKDLMGKSSITIVNPTQS